MRRPFKSFCVCAAIAAGVAVGPAAQTHEHMAPAGHAAMDAAVPLQSAMPESGDLAAGEKVWICPMHATVTQDHPGRCPICGMDLVLKKSTHTHSSAGVQVDEAVRQRLGIRLARAEHRSMAHDTRTYGTVALNEASLSTLTPKVEGWIKRLHVSAVGQQVKAGDVLYEIYSPDLIQRQREYLELLQRRDRLKEATEDVTGQTAQIAVSLARERQRARQKFMRADLDEDVLDEIERTGAVVEVVPVRAGRSGYVTRLDVREGAYVSPVVSLMSFGVADSVWINISLHQDELAWIADGDEVTVTVPNSRSGPLKGRLRLAAPAIDESTRTLPARILLSGPHAGLRPGMSVDVNVNSQPHQALTVPRSAVLRSGRGESVMVSGANGLFSPVSVMVGPEDREFVEITHGLNEGAEVAVNGQFLLDAAASLNDAAQRMRSIP